MYKYSVEKILIFIALTTSGLAAGEPVPQQTKPTFGLRGLAIEAYGQYSYQPAFTNASSLANPSLGGSGQTRLEYNAATMDGFGTGGNLLLEILPHTCLAFGFQYQSLGRVFRGNGYIYSTGGGSATTYSVSQTYTTRYSYQYGLFHIGPRFQVPIVWGEIYAGIGAGVVTPIKTSIAADYDYLSGYENSTVSTGSGTTTVPNVKSYTRTDNYNVGIVGVLDFGWQYPIFDRLSFGFGVNVVFGSVSNNNRTGTELTRYTDGTSSTNTIEYRDSFTLADKAGSTPTITNYGILNLTDVSVRGAISMRIF